MKPIVLSSVVAMAVTFTLIYAGAGYWSLLVYVVDIFSYACGRVRT